MNIEHFFNITDEIISLVKTDIVSYITHAIQSRCAGCLYGSASQEDHLACLMTSWEENVSRFFDVGMLMVSVKDVHRILKAMTPTAFTELETAYGEHSLHCLLQQLKSRIYQAVLHNL